MISKEDQKWLEDHNVWLDKEMINYDGYWYIAGYEWQYQYWADDGWEELHKTTTSPFLVSRYRSKSLKAVVQWLIDYRAKQGLKPREDGVSGMDWGYCMERHAKESDYFPKEFIELEAEA